MKHLPAVLFLLLQALNGFANMASPVRPGSRQADVFSSKDVAILQETIRITIDNDVTRARYQVEYLVQSPQGIRIPLLFLAKDLERDFRVSIDGQPQPLRAVPKEWNGSIPLSFPGFEGMQKPFDNLPNTAVIEWGAYETMICSPDELQYFDAALSKGIHRISVSYQARAWQDLSGWLTAYSHRYSLSPARHWRSFGRLDIVLEAVLPPDLQLSTNLGASPGSGSPQRWHFDKLPADYIVITLRPQISATAGTLMRSGPEGFMAIAAALLVFLHLYSMYRFRKARPDKKYSPVLILGSIVVPFLVLAVYMLSFSWIDTLLGPHASGRHGYVFLVFVFYPILCPVYFLLLWLADRAIKRRLTRKSTNLIHP
ncbi:hypothetical protein [Taibaiella koreensis]|uniref:hypothetical protein n=1 Tax=Taibaiella koreensis TaxID=1268548 RepID=UPI0013C2B611|nr:hypothetical protein [Taibaiella koreensis]